MEEAVLEKGRRMGCGHLVAKKRRVFGERCWDCQAEAVANMVWPSASFNNVVGAFWSDGGPWTYASATGTTAAPLYATNMWSPSPGTLRWTPLSVTVEDPTDLSDEQWEAAFNRAWNPPPAPPRRRSTWDKLVGWLGL